MALRQSFAAWTQKRIERGNEGSSRRNEATASPVTRPGLRFMKGSKPEQVRRSESQSAVSTTWCREREGVSTWWCTSSTRAVCPVRSSITPSQMKSSGVSWSIVLRSRPRQSCTERRTWR